MAFVAARGSIAEADIAAHGVEVMALVDTGATFGACLLVCLKISDTARHSKERLEPGDGRIVVADLAEAFVGLNGKRGTTGAILGRPGKGPMLGAVTLEEFLPAPDLVRQRLMPVPGLLV
ncbi:MAG: hypothetical protein Q7R34_06935 [Dehalococcoidia bacterium]|nr:hypothetical protein [Dehalococcoidia bacterium]